MKKRYAVDLSAQMAESEANYARLMRLMPAFDEVDAVRYGIQGAELSLEVVERCRYTTMLQLTQCGQSQEWAPTLQFSIRMYHDARMAEVSAFQRQRRVDPVNQYPNPRMHQADEKGQWNRFLGECLSHCLRYGHTLDPMVARYA